jgi:ADP-ribose pyrophosphatase YjhB (NUDIX family)
MADEKQPDIQLIANLVVVRDDGNVLFVRYDPDDARWWLPGEDLEPYEHPDERARKELDRFGLQTDEPEMVFVESFRGRRGWHVVFHYRARSNGESTTTYQVDWFAPSDLPRTMHGRWGHDAVQRALTGSVA